MDYEKLASTLVKKVWGALRICSGVIVVVLVFSFVVAIVTSRSWEAVTRAEVDPLVCGAMSGIVYEFPRNYVIYWPEYEGKSSWEVGFTENKKGCGANLVSLYMAMSWPELKPVSFGAATAFHFSGVTVAIEPWVQGEAGLKRILEVYLRGTPLDVREKAVYEKNLRMNFVEGINIAQPDRKEDFFWGEEGGRLKYVVYCVRGYVESHSFCNLKFELPGKEILVSVRLLRANFSEWRRVVSSVEGFLLRGVKHG